MKNILYLLIAVMALAACSGRTKEQAAAQQGGRDASGLRGSIQLSGAFALYPVVVRWAEEFKKIHPGVQIDISGGGAGKGITDVLTGMVDIGMSSRDLQPEELRRGAWPLTVLRDAVVMIASEDNPEAQLLRQRGVKRSTATALWTDRITSWAAVTGSRRNIPVHVYTRSDACGAGETFAAWINMKQEDLGGTAVYGDPGIASAIQRDKVGIGYSNLGYVYDISSKRPQPGIMVVPMDLNGDGRISPDEDFYQTLTTLSEAIRTGRYPSPPSRDLFLVTKGRPRNPVVVAFLKYIYGKGQTLAGEVGYVPLSEKILNEQKARL